MLRVLKIMTGKLFNCPLIKNLIGQIKSKKYKSLEGESLPRLIRMETN